MMKAVFHNRTKRLFLLGLLVLGVTCIVLPRLLLACETCDDNTDPNGTEVPHEVHYQNVSATGNKFGFREYTTNQPPKYFLKREIKQTASSVSFATTRYGSLQYGARYLGPRLSIAGTVMFSGSVVKPPANASVTFKLLDFGTPYETAVGSAAASLENQQIAVDYWGEATFSYVFKPVKSGPKISTYDLDTGDLTETGTLANIITLSGPAVTSPTTQYEEATGASAARRDYTLSEEFTDAMLEAKVKAATTVQNVGAFSTLAVSAARDLSDDRTGLYLKKARYYLTFPSRAGVRYRVDWNENLIKEDGTLVPPRHRSFMIDGTPDEAQTPVQESLPDEDGEMYLSGFRVTVVGHALRPSAGGCDFGGCASEGGGLPGSGLIKLGSVDVALKLGWGKFGLPSGELAIREPLPSRKLATPTALSLTSAGSDVDTVASTNGVIQQVKSTQCLANVVVSNECKYAVQFFTTNNVGVKTNGFYPFSGSPFVTWIIENPTDTTNSFNKLRVTEVRGSKRIVSEYTWKPESSTWELVAGNGLRIESVQTQKLAIDFTDYRIETRELRNGSNRQLVAKSIRKLELGTWGERVVEERLDPDGANLTTTYAYDDDTEDVTKMVSFDGSWVKYEYDALHRMTKKVEPYLNSVVTSIDASNRVTGFLYSTNEISGAGDNGFRKTFTPRRVKQTIPGPGGTAIITSLQWNVVLDEVVRNITYTGGTESYTNALNLVSVKTEHVEEDTFEGYPESSLYADGTLKLYEYSRSGDGLYQTNKIYQGASNNDQTAVVDGTLTIEVLTVSGQLQSLTVKDVLSGKTISSVVNSDFDEAGRPQLMTYIDGTTAVRTYACCGLESETGRDGSVSAYSFDDLKRLRVISRDGVTLINEYDAADRVISATRQGTDGSSVLLGSSVFDLSGRVTAGFDIRGTESTLGYQYATNGSSTLTLTLAAGTALEATAVQVTARDGSTLKTTGSGVYGRGYEYEPGGALGGRVVALDASGDATSEWVESIFDPAGRPMTNRFRLSTNVTAETQFIYNNQGQLAKTVAADGVITLFQYNAQGELEYSAIDMDRDSVIDFDGTDRVVQMVTDTVSSHGVDVIRSRAYIWGTNGIDSKSLMSTREIAVGGMQGWVTAYGLTSYARKVYAGNGLCYVTNSSPDGAYTVITTTNGRALSVSSHDTNGVQLGKVTLAYDAHRRLASRTDERNGTETFTYNAADQMASVTTPVPGSGQAAQVTQMYYDALGRAQRIVLPDGGSVTNEYQLTGELKKTAGSRTYPVEYGYDHQGRLKTLKTWQNQAANTGTATTTWNYDAYSGFLTGKRYADDQGVDYGYYMSGAKGRLQTRTWARGVTTTYSYNNAGSVAGVDYSDATPDLGYTYDRRGRVTEVTQGSNTVALAYNEAGLMLQEAWTAGLLNGLVVTNGYDGLLRRQSLQLLQSGTVKAQTAYGYDGASRLQSVTDGTNGVTYAYVPNSPLVGSVTYARSGTTKLVRTNSYDALNRLTALTFSSVGGFSSGHEYLYDRADQRTKVTLPDGSYWQYEYDKLGQVTGGTKHAANGTALPGQQFGYGFDDIGNRTVAERSGREGSYTPNLLNQYTGRTNPGYVEVVGTAETNATVTVNYQRSERSGTYYRKELAADNSAGPVWLSVTNLSVLNDGTNPDIVKSSAGKRYVPPASESYAYDGDGNRTNDGHWTYVWDAENRLVQMETKSSAVSAGIPKEKLEYNYDYRSRRIGKKSYSGWNGSAYTSTSEKRFVYDGWNLVAEFSVPSGLLLDRSYVWGLDLSLSLRGAGGVGGLVSMTETSGNTSQFYAYDGNGNVVGLIDASSGSETARYEYGPFGEVIRSTGLLAEVNPYRFSTKYQDDESGLLYYGYRYYEPETGRWLSRDLMGENGGVNLYEAFFNAPTRFADRDGKDNYGGGQNTVETAFFDISKSSLKIRHAAAKFPLREDGSGDVAILQLAIDLTLPDPKGAKETADTQFQIAGDPTKSPCSRASGALIGTGVTMLAVLEWLPGGKAASKGGKKLLLREAEETVEEIVERSAKEVGDQAGHKYATTVTEGGTGKAFAGHGDYYMGSGQVEIPQGTTLSFYGPHGEGIPDEMGKLIEAGKYDEVMANPEFRQLVEEGAVTHLPGSKVHDYTLSAPGNLNIMSRSMTLEDAKPLSLLLKPGQGHLDWASCRKVQ